MCGRYGFASIIFLCLILFQEQLKLKDTPEGTSKPETGSTVKQFEALKQVSSLVAMFQQEALNEKQTRLLAQLKALEKVHVFINDRLFPCFSFEAVSIILKGHFGPNFRTTPYFIIHAVSLYVVLC